MLRRLVSTLFAVVIVASCLLAAEYKGKVKSVDADKGTITVTIDDQDKEFKVTDDTKIVSAKSGKDVADRLKGKAFQKAGGAVTITTEKKDGKEVVTEIKVGGGKKKN